MADLLQIKEQLITAVENLSSSNTNQRRKAINTFSRIFASSDYTIQEAFIVKEMIEPHIPTLIKLLKDEGETLSFRKDVARTLSKMPIFYEAYPVLLDLFKKGIRENQFSLDIGELLFYYPLSYTDIKNAILELLQSPVQYHKILGLVQIRRLLENSKIGKKTEHSLKSRTIMYPEFVSTYKLQEDWLLLVRNIVRESKDKEIAKFAWYTLMQFPSSNVDNELKLLQRDLLYKCLFEILAKCQPGIQVQLSRIIELTTPLIKERGVIPADANLTNLDYPKELYVQVIKEIIQNKDIDGEFFDLEQVFIKRGKGQKFSLSSSMVSKKFICGNCGMPINPDDTVCPTCNQEILRCAVCKLPISFGEEAGKCSLCGSVAHLSHFQEWVKIKGKCPTCQKKIPLEGIVPLSMEIKKT